MAPHATPSPLTRLDVFLIVTAALVAFAVGGFWGPWLTRLVVGPGEPIAKFEASAGLPVHRDDVARIDRQLLKLRDRIAIEDVGRVAEPLTSARRTVTIQALQRRAALLVDTQAQARLRLGRAELRTQRMWASAARVRRLAEGLGVAAASFAVLLMVGLLVVGLRALTRVPIAVGWVVAGSALVLLAILVADAVGFVAALALAAVVVLLVVAQGTPREQLRSGRTTA